MREQQVSVPGTAVCIAELDEKMCKMSKFINDKRIGGKVSFEWNTKHLQRNTRGKASGQKVSKLSILH